MISKTICAATLAALAGCVPTTTAALSATPATLLGDAPAGGAPILRFRDDRPARLAAVPLPTRLPSPDAWRYRLLAP